MPRSQGTSRKGKPGKKERESGMGKALQKAQGPRYKPKMNGKSQGGGGMSMTHGVKSIGIEVQEDRTRSVLDMHDLDDFLAQADLANREFLSEREGLVVLDETGQAYKPPSVQWEDQKSDFIFTELSVPRRPPWDDTTSPEELEHNEHQSFLEWRRAIAAKEEELVRLQSVASVTPFEKNIEVWRQLWRVMERCSVLLQLVDARNPLFYLSADLRDYAQSLGKPMMVLINKSDYLSPSQRAQWRDYLLDRGWDPVFFSATMEQKKIDDASQVERRLAELAELRRDDIVSPENEEEENAEEEVEKTTEQPSEKDSAELGNPPPPVESSDGFGVDMPLTREQLMDTMAVFARKHDCQPDPKSSRIQFGMVGFPNVGKSSGKPLPS
jgi:large subunit GTPase 1